MTTDPAQSADYVRVHEWPDGFVDVWVPCEHGDPLRDQVAGVLRFKRVGGCWQIIICDDLLHLHPEATQAVLGVAIRELAHRTRGDANG